MYLNTKVEMYIVSYRFKEASFPRLEGHESLAESVSARTATVENHYRTFINSTLILYSLRNTELRKGKIRCVVIFALLGRCLNVNRFVLQV